MQKKIVVAEAIENLKSYSQTERIILAQTNYPTSMTVLGVRNPDEIKVLNNVKEDISFFDRKDRIDVAKRLVRTNILECQHLAHSLIGKDSRLQELLTLQDILDLEGVLDNWVSVDTYALYITGYGYRENILPEKYLIKWLRSPNYWYRRLALVSTIPLNLKSQGGKGDPERTLRICTYAISDKNDIVIKALSWALRELLKRSPEIVNEFINKHKDDLHSRVIREVNNKLKTGRKN